MPITLQVTAATADAARFPLSPLMELGHAWHVLVQPQHHGPWHAWVVTCRQRLGREGRRQIAAFAWMVHGFVADVFQPAAWDRPTTWADDMAAAAAAPLNAWIEAVALAFTPEWAEDPTAEAVQRDPGVQTLLRSTAQTHGRAARAAVECLIADPVSLRRAWMSATERLWEVLAPIWFESHPLLMAARERLRDRWSQGDPRLTLVEWFRRGRLDGTAFIVPSHHTHTIRLDAPFFITPSRFAWPHVRVTCDPPSLPGFTIPLEMPDAPRDDPRLRELAAILGALADPGRLRLYQHLVRYGPQTTGQLSQALHLTVSGTSRQLHRLAQAGWVTEHRRSYYVFYEAVPFRPDCWTAWMSADDASHIPEDQ
jgi:DNA-binding transcriptional ArsR family regulator